MRATLEISMYPLLQKNKEKEYKKIVKKFLSEISKKKGLIVESNGLSSIVYGDYKDIILLLQEEVRDYLKKYRSVFVFKIGKGTLSYSNK
tara:strand:+ start:568 stop:837 length:270 start_codon:yes stop_codon:yes gene_type:complete